MSTPTPAQVIEAPTGSPLPFGLLSAAPPIAPPDGRWQLGTVYEADYCGPAETTEGACRVPDWGTISVSVGTTRGATLTVTGFPPGSYDIDWGDGTVASDDTTPSGNTRTYAADGSKVITVTGPDGYFARVVAVVTNGSASGPYAATAVHQNVPQTGIDQVTGFPFVVYSSFNCNLVGSWDRGEARARQNVMGGEGRAVEAVVVNQLALDSDAVDLTPSVGTAVHPVTGLAILEGYAAQNYPYVPVLHAPRTVGTLLGSYQAVSRQGQRLETTLGARVAAGGGYEGGNGPADTAPGDGEAWLWITGQVQILRTTDVRVIRQEQPALNGLVALGQRPYAVSWECVAAAVLVSTDYGIPT